MYQNVYSSAIYNSLKAETHHIPTIELTTCDIFKERNTIRQREWTISNYITQQ